MKPTQTSPSRAALCCDGELRQRIQTLRGALQGLAQDMETDSVHGAKWVEALHTLAQIDQSTNDLLQYAFPTPVENASCSLVALIQRAIAHLEPNERARLLLEIKDADASVVVDAKLFAERLAFIVRSALQSQAGTVFLHAHPLEDDLHLTVVWTCRPEHNNSFQATIGYQLALRDLERLGVHASQPELPGQENCLVLRLSKAENQKGVQ